MLQWNSLNMHRCIWLSICCSLRLLEYCCCRPNSFSLDLKINSTPMGSYWQSLFFSGSMVTIIQEDIVKYKFNTLILLFHFFSNPWSHSENSFILLSGVTHSDYSQWPFVPVNAISVSFKVHWYRSFYNIHIFYANEIGKAAQFSVFYVCKLEYS